MPTARRVLLWSFATIASIVALRAAEDPESAEKKYVLYLGLDVDVTLEDTTTRVVDADASSVQVELNEKRRRIPLRLGGKFKTTVVPRVGPPNVNIEDLRGEPSYTRQSDPQERAAVQQMIMVGIQEMNQEVAEAEMIRAEIDMFAAGSAVEWARAVARENPGFGVSHPGPSAAQMEMRDSAMDALLEATGNPVYSSVPDGNGLAAPTNPQYDALRISFRVSAREQVGDAYGVIRVFLRLPDKADESASSIRFFRLVGLGPKPQKVTFLNDGLPPGYKLERYEVHIYKDGREFATNVSNNRIELSQDEIHQFLVLKYMSENAEGSAPVAIATEMLENDLRQLVPEDQRNRTVEVSVDANGRATKVTLENTGWSAADAYLTTVINDTRYLPALRNGKAVSGEGKFFLYEFFP